MYCKKMLVVKSLSTTFWCRIHLLLISKHTYEWIGTHNVAFIWSWGLQNKWRNFPPPVLLIFLLSSITLIWKSCLTNVNVFCTWHDTGKLSRWVFLICLDRHSTSCIWTQADTCMCAYARTDFEITKLNLRKFNYAADFCT